MVDVPPTRSRRFYRSVAGLILILVIVAIVVGIVNSSQPSRNEQPSPPRMLSSSRGVRAAVGSGHERIANYMGEAACRECHPGESALYSRSGHARTLVRAERSPAVSWLDGRTLNDPEEAGVAWSYHLRDGKLAVDRASGDRIETLILDFALGSGKHGVTFVAVEPDGHSVFDPAGIEHRMSYFAAGRRLDITPGQEKAMKPPGGHETVPFGSRHTPLVLRQCFSCHSTLTSTFARDRLEITTLIPNVSCERCHGPAREHVAAARRGEPELKMRMGHERALSSVEVGVCGECHRLPRSVPSSSVVADNLAIVRFQGVGLSMSPCYAGGSGELRCTSCHDPHDRVSRDQAAYDSVCLTCHGRGSVHQRCPTSATDKCISCHMPKLEVPPVGDFTNHWIGKPAPRVSALGPKITASRQGGVD